MPCLTKMAEKMRMDDERIFGITKLKLQAALEMILGDIVVKVSSMMERTSIQIQLHNLHQGISRREFRSLRSDSHTICDSKHSIC